ncbi:UNVERIFIED_CONTAM: hypothetical protein GTU68_021387 [Idotea baltica]|nr:hypothetical protein [Idotea baltica]
MSSKRKIEDTRDKVWDEQNDLLLEIDEGKNQDSTDEELSDIDINEVDDDFDDLNLNSDDEGVTIEKERDESDGWEDVDDDDDEEDYDDDEDEEEESTDSDYDGGSEDAPLPVNRSSKKKFSKGTSSKRTISSKKKKETDAEEADEWEDVTDEEDDHSDSDYFGSSREDVSSKSGTSKGKSSAGGSAKSTQNKKSKEKVSKKNTLQSQGEANKSTSQEGQSEAQENSADVDEYAQDSSDEEDLRNTIGNIPINWYDEYDHLGYGLDSLPIYKPKQGDVIDKFLEKVENPDFDRTVFDKQTGQNVRLSDAHLDFIHRVMGNKVPNSNYDMYAPFEDLYSHEVMRMPLSGRPKPKRAFIPSKIERKKVARLSKLMKRGLYKRNRYKKEKKAAVADYDLWKPRSEDDPRLGRIRDHIPPPKMLMPGHADSYNPAPEFIVSHLDEKALRGKYIHNRKLFQGFWRKFKSVREIPAYPKVFKERYNRLMDLYLAPRKREVKIVAKSTDFLPKLPDKKDLRPYPTMEGLRFVGHRSIVRTLAMHPGGKYLASGSDDHTVRVWEVSTGRCLRIFETEEVVQKVSWNPKRDLFLLGIAFGKMVVFLNPETYLTDKLVIQQTNSIFEEEVQQGDYIAPQKVQDAVTWRKPTTQEWEKGYRVVLDHFKEVKEIVWHPQGDYFATLIPDGINKSVITHQLSRWRSQLPFQRNKGKVQRICFHPKMPHLFVVVRLYLTS